MLSFSFLRVNFQFTLLRPRIMQDGAPLITLVKKGELAERPAFHLKIWRWSRRFPCFAPFSRLMILCRF